jgi:cystathionine beta-lyase/cystathionine gamma-synthase
MFGESKAYGAMITLELKGGRRACDYFVENIAGRIPYLVTLGDGESTLLHVATVFGEERYPFPGMIRMSIGFERYEDIERAVLRALDAIPSC